MFVCLVAVSVLGLGVTEMTRKRHGGWQDLRTPDLFEEELDAGRPIRFVRLDALRRFAGQ